MIIMPDARVGGADKTIGGNRGQNGKMGKVNAAASSLAPADSAWICAADRRFASIQHALMIGTVERKRRHLDLEPLAALGHHLVGAGHEA